MEKTLKSILTIIGLAILGTIIGRYTDIAIDFWSRGYKYPTGDPWLDMGVPISIVLGGVIGGILGIILSVRFIIRKSHKIEDELDHKR